MNYQWQFEGLRWGLSFFWWIEKTWLVNFSGSASLKDRHVPSSCIVNVDNAVRVSQSWSYFHQDEKKERILAEHFTLFGFRLLKLLQEYPHIRVYHLTLQLIKQQSSENWLQLCLFKRFILCQFGCQNLREDGIANILWQSLRYYVIIAR